MKTPSDHRPDPRLDALLIELRRTKRVRRQRGLAAVAGAIAIVLLLPAAMLIHTPATPTTPPTASGGTPHGGTVASTPPDNDPLPTDVAQRTEPTQSPGPTLRLITVSTQRTASSVQMIENEQELLRILRETGRPTGIIRTHGRSFIEADWLTKAEEDERQSESSPTPPSPTA